MVWRHCWPAGRRLMSAAEPSEIVLGPAIENAMPREGRDHHMPSASAQSTRAAPQPLRLWRTVAAITVLFCGTASAQTAGDGGGVQNTRVQAAYAGWRKLSQSEVDC